jgi:mannose-1-phosphate guanylyltransferase
VLAFKEKPNAASAVSYLASGEYRWNAGMFVARARTLLERLEEFHPRLARGLLLIARAWDTPDRARVLDEVWPQLTKITIDHAIAEPLAARGGMAVVEGHFGWDDVGDWRSLGEQVVPGFDGVRYLGADTESRPPTSTVVLDSPGTLLASQSERLVAVVGVPDAVIVDTPDVLLVTTRDKAQSVKDVVAELERRGRRDVL